MYAINITPNNSEKCSSCQNSFIQYIGTQAWCTNCNRAVITIEQQTKVVPKMYQSNSGNKLSSTEIKIKNYLNEFCNKYGGVNDMEQVNFLYQQVLELKNKKGFTSKNYRQNSAVIVYVHFKDCHRLSMKEFCKKNQVDQKAFNKSYLTYQKLLKEKAQISRDLRGSFSSKQENVKEEDLKIQCTESEEWEKEESDNLPHEAVDYSSKDRGSLYSRELNLPESSNAKVQQNTRNQHFDRTNNKNTTIQHVMLNNTTLHRQIRSFLQAIFDSFFTSLLYIQKKPLLIEELTDQVLQIYQTLKLLFQSSNSSFYISLYGAINDQNFYKYLFYLVLRRISHGISQVKYRKVIQDSTGQMIKATVLKAVIRALDFKEETASSFSGESLFFVQNSGTTGSEFVKIEEKD